MVELFRISTGREFQMMGAATEKLPDPKPVQTVDAAQLYARQYTGLTLTQNGWSPHEVQKGGGGRLYFIKAATVLGEKIKDFSKTFKHPH